MTITMQLTERERSAVARIDVIYALSLLRKAIKRQTEHAAADSISRAMDNLERAAKALTLETLAVWPVQSILAREEG